MELGFPWWLRIEHFANIIFITFFIRSGIEIIGTWPKFYRSVDCEPGKAWAKFTIKEQPKNKYYGSIDEEEDYSPVLAIPGTNKLGSGRYWHWIMSVGFITFGVIYVVLLLATGQWQRYIPADWGTFARAWDDLVSYVSFQIPAHVEGAPFNALQQLSYGFIILILSPIQILTGLLQSPAITARWPWASRMLGGRQSIRSMHLIGLAIYAVFIVVHVLMVVLHGYGRETSKMVFGNDSRPLAGGLVFTAGLLLLLALHIWATYFTARRPRSVQRLAQVLFRPFLNVVGRLDSRQQYPDSMITESPVTNGRCPQTPAYQALAVHDFSDFRLEVGGLVENPLSLTLADLRELAQQHSQTTVHHCVQGFTSIGKWGGVPVSRILELAKPLPGATDVAYMSFQQMDRDDPGAGGSGHFYETSAWSESHLTQTILAFEMNDGELPLINGAPIRLRLETSTGFRMCKWVERLEVVNGYDVIGHGRGGWWEDTDLYDRAQFI